MNKNHLVFIVIFLCSSVVNGFSADTLKRPPIFTNNAIRNRSVLPPNKASIPRLRIVQPKVSQDNLTVTFLVTNESEKPLERQQITIHYEIKTLAGKPLTQRKVTFVSNPVSIPRGKTVDVGGIPLNLAPSQLFSTDGIQLGLDVSANQASSSTTRQTWFTHRWTPKVYELTGDNRIFSFHPLETKIIASYRKHPVEERGDVPYPMDNKRMFVCQKIRTYASRGPPTWSTITQSATVRLPTFRYHSPYSQWPDVNSTLRFTATKGQFVDFHEGKLRFIVKNPDISVYGWDPARGTVEGISNLRYTLTELGNTDIEVLLTPVVRDGKLGISDITVTRLGRISVSVKKPKDTDVFPALDAQTKAYYSGLGTQVQLALENYFDRTLIPMIVRTMDHPAARSHIESQLNKDMQVGGWLRPGRNFPVRIMRIAEVRGSEDKLLIYYYPMLEAIERKRKPHRPRKHRKPKKPRGKD